jgi:hypothetical protein
MSMRRFKSEAGFTLVEMLISAAIMLTVTAGVFTLMNPSEGIYKAQPEASDMQQRMRIGVDTLSKDLVMAGAGTYVGAVAGALYNYFAPVMPYRVGDSNSDPAAGIYYRSDAITLLYVPPTPSQTTIKQGMPRTSKEFKVNPQPNCPPIKQNSLCGFKEGMRALIFDKNGAWDAFTLTQIQDPAIHLQHSGDLSADYDDGSQITQVATHTYYLKTDVNTNTYQLMHYDGYKTDLPVVDNVVKLEFQYFGDPQPPTLIPGKSLADLVGPWTTYGPKPPPLGVDNGSDSWPAGENCLFSLQAGQQLPRLPVLAAGNGQVPLPAAMLNDGPWCPDATFTNRFDADLLRIRRVRVNLRVQVAPSSLRGPAGLLFTRGGTAKAAERYVPDQEISFDITPRNMNLGR